MLRIRFGWVVKKKAAEVYAAQQPRGIDNEMNIMISMQNKSAQEIECAYVFITSSNGRKASNSAYLNIDNKSFVCCLVKKQINRNESISVEELPKGFTLSE